VFSTTTHLAHVNSPPAKADGFGFRLKAGSARHAADYTTLKSSSGSGGFWFFDIFFPYAIGHVPA